MGCLDHGNPLFPVQTLHCFQQHRPARRIEHRRRFIQKQAAGAQRQKTGQGHSLLFTTRELMRRETGPVGDPHKLQGSRYPAANLRRSHSAVLQAESNIFFHRGAHDLVVGVLKDHAAERTDLRNAVIVCRGEAVDENLAPGRAEQGVELFQQRALARSVCSHQGNMLTRTYFKVDLF